MPTGVLNSTFGIMAAIGIETFWMTVTFSFDYTTSVDHSSKREFTADNSGTIRWQTTAWSLHPGTGNPDALDPAFGEGRVVIDTVPVSKPRTTVLKSAQWENNTTRSYSCTGFVLLLAEVRVETRSVIVL